MEKVTLNEPGPDFSFTATGNIQQRLSDLRGQPVILYFYPKDDTPGCTKESCDFNHELNAFNQLKAKVFGISRDSLASHEKFKAKFGLQFELIADINSELCQLFDVIKDKNMYGKIVKGIQRSTFLLDEDGILRYEWRKVSVPKHVTEVLAALTTLTG
jgi:peroxiredoxin Q/BCP